MSHHNAQSSRGKKACLKLSKESTNRYTFMESRTVLARVWWTVLRNIPCRYPSCSLCLIVAGQLFSIFGLHMLYISVCRTSRTSFKGWIFVADAIRCKQVTIILLPLTRVWPCTFNLADSVHWLHTRYHSSSARGAVCHYLRSWIWHWPYFTQHLSSSHRCSGQIKSIRWSRGQSWLCFYMQCACAAVKTALLLALDRFACIFAWWD